MSAYAPVFANVQSDFFLRQQQRENKRRKLHTHAEDSDVSDTNEELHKVSSTHHPVKRTDPYHVAGWPREADLPPPPFPHAPTVKERSATLDPDAELANLNPPLYSVKSATEDKSLHLKRSHASNMTAIMHKLMLNGDWNRASRAWGLLLRTEIGGKGPAIRQHGSWSVGAELLMRRDEHGHGASAMSKDRGFQLVRKYYERLVLQFPKTARSKAKVTALSIYPAMFNVWIYEVQQRSKKERENITADMRAKQSENEAAIDPLEDEHARRVLECRRTEVEGVTAIIRRLDDLMSGPPYDDYGKLLLLRGMCGIWLADLKEHISQSSPQEDSLDYADVSRLDDERDHARSILRKAQDVLRRTEEKSDVLPSSIQQMLDDWQESEIK